jgi:predicted PP-loop superfamily ATPase
MKLEFSRKMKNEISNFMKIRTVGAEFHMDGQTDTMKLIVAFSGFADGSKNVDSDGKLDYF